MTESIDGDKWEFKIDTWYEFTMCPNDQYQYKINRHKKIYKDLEEVFDQCEFKYLLLPEVSMLQFNRKSKIPRVHYHGIIKFTRRSQIVNWLLRTSLKLEYIGIYQYNPYRESVWPEYITKHQYLFKRLDIRITNMFEDDLPEEIKEKLLSPKPTIQ